jgi:prevent-host-death family protein
MIVNMHEAKTHFSRYVARALSGEEVLIAKNGKPLVRLVPADLPSGRRKPGISKGSIVISEDFEKPLPEDLLRGFES